MANMFVKKFEVQSGSTAANVFESNEEYTKIFAKLIGGHEKEFFDDCWEKVPCHFSNSLNASHSKGASGLLFSKDHMLSMVHEFQLETANNFNVVKYDGARKTTYEFSEELTDYRRQLIKAFKEGYTVQFFQPQRFSDVLFRVNASFENKFGTLAGASAYLTPAHTQGLAPHHDDVEVFIFQLEGSKAWNLWDYSCMPEDAKESELPLPENYSHDIDRQLLPSIPSSSSSAPSKCKCQTVLLQEGDMLYLPRGTIHEAAAQDRFSTHVTISLYQHYNYKAVVNRLLRPLVETAFMSYMPLRQGLPRLLHRLAGSGAAAFVHDHADENSASSHSKGRRDEFLHTTKEIIANLPQFLTNSIVDTAVDEIVSDFMSNRLPPPDLALPVRRPLVPSKSSKPSKESNGSNGSVVNLEENKLLLHDLDESFDRWRLMLQTQGTWNNNLHEKLATLLLQATNGPTSHKGKGNKPATKKSKKDSTDTSNDNISTVEDIQLKMCDMNSMHMEIINADGQEMLSLTTCRFNSRLAHMGHPLPTLIQDDIVSDKSCCDGEGGSESESDDDSSSIGDKFDKLQSKQSAAVGSRKRKSESQQQENDADSDDEDDGKGSTGSSLPDEEAEGNQLAPWAVVLPLACRPLVFYLLYHSSEAEECVSLNNLINTMHTKHGIDAASVREEKMLIIFTCSLICGFI